ncbi:uncharacterized protein LOC125178216, partial [Hyalella azteca]|uniref:Uncharacterized protein LOC125178216 n=1 Tax=Hyalella azteca TaxID=294128 RepID=A0A979FK64_HYAAZ
MARLVALFVALLAQAAILTKGLRALKAYKIRLSASDLSGSVVVTSYMGAGSSVVKCAGLAAASGAAATPVFCITLQQTCLVTNAYFPPGYISPEPQVHQCYTTTAPLFDMTTALATCPAQYGCCLEPFESVSNVGCIYANASFLPPKPYATARAMCQSLWPTADLLVPYAWGNLDDYLKARGVEGPWLGAKKNTATSQWQWVDGTTVSASSWGSKLLGGLLKSQ